MDQIIVTDLDGTLLIDSIEIDKKDLEKIKKLGKEYKLAVATGRSIKEIKYIETNNNLTFKYKIGFNGAMIEDDKGTVIFEKTIPNDVLERLYKFLKENNLIFDALDGERRIGNFMHENPKSLWNMDLICVDNPYELLENSKIYKVNIRPDKNNCDKILNKLKAEFNDLSIFKSASTRIEVCAKGLSKGFAIDKIRELTQGYIIGIGDSGNDISMFERVDLPICMEHANQNVKQFAKVLINKIENLKI